MAYLVALTSLSSTIVKSEGIKNDPRYKPSNAVADNLNVKDVPKKFMGLVLSYMESNTCDAPHHGHEIERKEKVSKILEQINSEYADEAEGYFVEIVKQSSNSMLRRFSHQIYLETELNDGKMLGYARDSLSNRKWEDGVNLDLDIRNQMKVLIAYGDESDLELWENIWNRMDERERHSFDVYRKMLTKALKGKDKPTRVRAARGDKAAENKLLGKKPEEQKPSELLQNKQILVGGVVLVILIIIYVFLKLKNRNSVS